RNWIRDGRRPGALTRSREHYLYVRRGTGRVSFGNSAGGDALSKVRTPTCLWPDADVSALRSCGELPAGNASADSGSWPLRRLPRGIRRRDCRRAELGDGRGVNGLWAAYGPDGCHVQSPGPERAPRERTRGPGGGAEHGRVRAGGRRGWGRAASGTGIEVDL